jgi:mannose-6-phosphate isomerase-like protein (cupin superfamily)
MAKPETPKYIRRIVTGHNADGRSVILSDGMPPNVRDKGTDVDFIEIWNTAASPVPITTAEPEPTDGPLKVAPAPTGTKIRVNDFYPGHILKLPERKDGRHRMMHRTRSVDYGIVLEGEIYMIMDDQEVLLKAGDIVIQRGTDHAWENRSDKLCRMAFILVGGEFSQDLLKILPNELELRS